MKNLKWLVDTSAIVLCLLLTVACTTQTPRSSDTEQLMGEALTALGSHDLYEAEQNAFRAAILSQDSTEMADALTMLSLVYMLEGKDRKAKMVLEVLPKEQTMAFVRLQSAANEQSRRHDRFIFGGVIAFFVFLALGGIWRYRRREAAFQQKVDGLMANMVTEAEKPEEQPAALLRADIVRTKQGVDVLYAIQHDENISQMGKRQQEAVSETLRIVEPRLAAVLDTVELTPKETFYCIMHYYGKTEQQKAQCFCCTEQALRSTKSRLGKKLDLSRLTNV